MFEDFEFEEKHNPWDVSSLEKFRFYNCPECDTKNVSKTEFITHAVKNHVRSQDVIDRLEGKKSLKKDDVTHEICEKNTVTSSSVTSQDESYSTKTDNTDKPKRDRAATEIKHAK